MKNQLPRTVEVVACCGYWVEILAGSRVAGTCISWFRVDLGPIEGMVEMVDVRDIISMMMLCNDIIIIEHDGRRPGLLMHHSIWNMTTTETTEQSTSIALALNIQHNPYNPGTPIIRLYISHHIPSRHHPFKIWITHNRPRTSSTIPVGIQAALYVS